MSDLIQRALITRIEHLERELAERERNAVELAAIWELLFPERHGESFDAGAVVGELRRRGLVNGRPDA